MKQEQFQSLVRSGLEDLVVHTEDVKGARILVAPTEATMGELAGLYTLGHWIENRERKVRMDFARAPSMVQAWRTWAKYWRPGMRPDHSLMVPFDEIRGGEYRALEANELRVKAPAHSLPPTLDIDPGDGSQAHVEGEVVRLNEEVHRFIGEDVASFALAGTSPNPTVKELVSHTYDQAEFEIHIAFDRPGLTHVEAPFKAIPMSSAASAQQQKEEVVSEASSLESDWVVTMTGHHLSTQTDSIVFSIPDSRGVNIYRMFNQEMTTAVPATLMQQHPGLGKVTNFGIPRVIVCMTRESWKEYQRARTLHAQTGYIPGLA